MINVFKYCIFIFCLELVASHPGYDDELLAREYPPFQQQYFTPPYQNAPATLLRHPPRLIQYNTRLPDHPSYGQIPAVSPVTVHDEPRRTSAEKSNIAPPQQLLGQRIEQWPQNAANFVPRHSMMQMPISHQPQRIPNPRLQVPILKSVPDSYKYLAPEQYKVVDGVQFKRDSTAERTNYPIYYQQPMRTNPQQNWVKNGPTISDHRTNNLEAKISNIKENVSNNKKHTATSNTDQMVNLYNYLNAQFQNKQYSPEQNIRHLLLNNPAIRKALAPPPAVEKKRYVVIHENGTIEHVERLEKVAEQFPDYILVKAELQPNNTGTEDQNSYKSKHEHTTKTNKVVTNNSNINNALNPVHNKYQPIYTHPQTQPARSPKPGQLKETYTKPANSNLIQNKYRSQLLQPQIQPIQSHNSPSTTTFNIADVPDFTRDSSQKWDSPKYPQTVYPNPKIHNIASKTQIETPNPSIEDIISTSEEPQQNEYPPTQHYPLQSSSFTSSNQQTTTPNLSSASTATSSAKSDAKTTSTVVKKSSANNNSDEAKNKILPIDSTTSDSVTEVTTPDTQVSPAKKANEKINEKVMNEDITVQTQIASNVQSQASSAVNDQSDTDIFVQKEPLSETNKVNQETPKMQSILTDKQNSSSYSEADVEATSKISTSSDSRQQERDSTNTSVESDNVEVNNRNRVTSNESESKASAISSALDTELDTLYSDLKDNITASEILTNKALELLFTASMLSHSDQEKEDKKTTKKPFEWFSTSDPDFWSKILGDNPSTIVYFFQAPSKSNTSSEDDEDVDSSGCGDTDKPPITN